MLRALIEICCDADSTLGFGAEARGIMHKRITIHDRFDTPAGVAMAQAFIARQRTDVFVALPCTAWCSWNHLNAARHGEAFRARLAWRRRCSLRMAQSAEDCCASALAGGGGVFFEWPRYCAGWAQPQIRRMVRRLGLELADFDFDVRFCR